MNTPFADWSIEELRLATSCSNQFCMAVVWIEIILNYLEETDPVEYQKALAQVADVNG